jgi:hypothetical protein
LSGPSNIPASRDGLLRPLAVAAVLAVVFYIAAFWGIEHWRAAEGPWEITFLSDGAGRPSLDISQPALKISERLSFPDEKVARLNLAERVNFRDSVTNLPFGELLQQDPLHLPGTIAMRLFGRQVQVLPRTLIVDKTEHPWQAGGEIVVRETEKKQDGWDE